MQSVTDNVTAKLRRNSFEISLDEAGMESHSEEDEEEEAEEKPKKKATKCAETPKSEENDDDVAYL